MLSDQLNGDAGEVPVSRSRTVKLIAAMSVIALAAHVFGAAGLRRDTANTFDDIVSMIEDVAAPTTKQGKLQALLERKLPKLMSGDRKASQCVGDIRKVIKKAGVAFDNERLPPPDDSVTFPDSRNGLADQIRRDAGDLRASVVQQLGANETLSPRRRAKVQSGIDRSRAAFDEGARLHDRFINPKFDEIVRVLAEFTKAMKRLERAVKKAQRFGATDIALSYPPILEE